jgi:ribosomal protein S18 acetylase RimI-like enzyme
MLTTRVLDAAAIEAEGWADPILELDRENLSALYARTGEEFPEGRVRAGLRNPATAVVLLLDGDALVGYAQFADDLIHEGDVHFGSLQLCRRYRVGRALAILIVESARVLRARPFTHLRAGVLKENARAVSLYRRLGFELRARPDYSTRWRAVGRRALLDSELLRSLERAVAGKYRRAE